MKLFRERYGDGGADAHGALQRDLGVMALGHVLDDGKPQTGAAGGTAVALIHPIEAFKNPVLGFLGNLPLVCHNAKFDCKFLERDLGAMGRSIENPVDDTLQLSRLKLKGLPSYKLGYLTDYFSIELNDAHRAWCDAEATANLYLRLQAV